MRQLNWRRRDPLHTAHMIKQGVLHDARMQEMIVAEESPPEPETQEVIHRTSSMSSGDFRLLQDTASKVDYLEKRLDGMSDRKRGTY